MPAKKKKTKATANTARGFATVSTVSKAKAAEADEPTKAPEELINDTKNESGQPDQPASGVVNSSLADLTPEELEARLEENELQAILDKYLDQADKEVARNVTRLGNERRLLRQQADYQNVRAWLSSEILEEISGLVERDRKAVLLNGSGPSSGSTGESSPYAIADESLVSLWILQRILQKLGFVDEDVKGALRQASRQQHPARTIKNVPAIIDGALLWLSSTQDRSQLPSYQGSGMGQTNQGGPSSGVNIPSQRGPEEEMGTQHQSSAQGCSAVQGAKGEGADVEAHHPHEGEGEVSEPGGGQAEAAETAAQRGALGSGDLSLDGERPDAVNMADVTEDSAADESDVSSVEADDPRAEEIHLQLMTRLHKRRPDLTETTSSKRKGKQGPKTNIPANESSEVRIIQAKLAALEDDILFDTDKAKARWSERRIDLVREEAQRKKYGLLQAPKHQDWKAKKAASLAPPEDDDESDMFGLGGLMEGLPQDTAEDVKSSATTSTTVNVRDFGKWTGTSPRKLLEEACRTRDSGARVTFYPVTQHSMSKRCAVTIRWAQAQSNNTECLVSEVSMTKSSKHVQYIMTGVSTPDATQAEAYIAVVALFGVFGAVNKDERIFMRLPPNWRDLWNELREAQKEQMDAKYRAELKAVRDLIEPDVSGSPNGVTEPEAPITSEKKASNTVASKNGPPSTQDQGHPSEHDRFNRPSRFDRMDAESLIELWSRKSATPAFAEMQKSRSQLPMWAYKDELLAAVDANQVVIVCGETGCGKSTQTPSFILEHELSRGKQCQVMCTEPRRISAVSLARRVSQELGEPRNAIENSQSLVGYAIRLDSKVSNMSRLIYATTGVMMRRLEQDPELKDVTHIIIDEVHERTIDSDFLLIVLKRLMPSRPDLKVILMSATVNAERFSNYFQGAPVFDVPGRTFPVEVRYLEDAIEATHFNHVTGDKKDLNSYFDSEDVVSDDMSGSERKPKADLGRYSVATKNVLKEYNEYRINYDLIYLLLQHLATSSDISQYSKAILIFLPGLAEIRRMGDILSGDAKFYQGFQIHALHSAIATEDQERAFLVPPQGMRKIVLATNIAETGVTIPDVTCVIDTGTHKEMRYDERRQLSRLTEVFISKANAKQRRGRAGRVQSGLCFHLFTKARHDTLMAAQQTPEIMRLSLQELVLRVKTCNMGGVEETLASALDPPLPKNVRRAIESLIDVKALTNGEDLTSLGRQLARMPLDVFLGKLVLIGSIFSCLDTTLSVAAILSNKSPFSAPMNSRDQADRARLAFKKGDSDLLTIYNAYTTWRQICKTKTISEQTFLRKNYLNLQTLTAIEDTKGQLTNVLIDTGFLKSTKELKASLAAIRNPRARNFVELPHSCTENDKYETIVNSVIAWSFYPKLLARDGKGWRNVANNQSVSLSPMSVNKGSSAGKYLSFYHIMQSMSKAYNAHETSVVEDFAVALLCGDADLKYYAGVLTIDQNRLRFALPDWEALHAMKVLRDNVKAVMNQRFRNPGRELTGSQRAWLEVWQKIFRGRDGG